jgi:4-hydroxyphenylacetate 3-monooxygenase
MLGTASVFCHETWCGSLQPVAPGQEKDRSPASCRSTRGRERLSRKPTSYAVSEFDNPLAARFDKTDSAVLFENVKVPWERVFSVDNVEMSRAIYMHARPPPWPSQANVRFLEKLSLIVGIASKLAGRTMSATSAVQFTLDRLAAMRATLEVDHGPIELRRAYAGGYHVNRHTSMPRCIGAPITIRTSAIPCD